MKIDSREKIRLAALTLAVQSAGGLPEDAIFKRAEAFADFINGARPQQTKVEMTIRIPDPAKFIYDGRTDEAIPEGADLGGIEPGEEEPEQI